MPLVGERLSSDERDESYRGPRGEAAVMWAASPTVIALELSECGPVVGRRQLGFEHIVPARNFRAKRVALLNLSEGILNDAFLGG